MITKEQIEKLTFYELKDDFKSLGFNDCGTKFLSSGWCDLFLGWVRSLKEQDND